MTNYWYYDILKILTLLYRGFMKRVVMTKDATIAKRAGIGTSILGFLGSIGGAASTILTHEPVYVYSVGVASAVVGIAGIGLTLYANSKHGAEKEVVEIEQPNIPKIRIPEKKAGIITKHPEFLTIMNELEELEASEDIFYITIDKTNTDKIVVKSWVEHVHKTMYTLRDSSEIAK